MRVAISHDWLTRMRGGEKVLEALCRIFPGADIFTLFADPARLSPILRSHRIHTSPLNRLPGRLRYYPYLLPLMPTAIGTFDLGSYDLVISSSHAVAKGIRVPAGVPHICYCHTPMRYIWDTAGDYFQFGALRAARRVMMSGLTKWLRCWDSSASQGVTHFIANSGTVRCRIRKAYDRDAHVLYPPVDTGFFTPGRNGRRGDYYLVVSALEPYKRVDIAVSAFNRLGTPLVVAGRGSQMASLRRLAGPNIRLMGWVNDEDLLDLYRNCRALIVSGREDFGIAPVEAQACGAPVIAFGEGGVTESVVPGVTGLFFPRQTPRALANCVITAERLSFNREIARCNALRFSPERFESGFIEFLDRQVGINLQGSPATRAVHAPGDTSAVACPAGPDAGGPVAGQPW